MAPSTSSSTTKGRRHECHICKREFTRAEHVQRHLMSHQNKRPFQCQYCGTKYGRADVLTRHIRKCSTNLANTSTDALDQTQDVLAEDSNDSRNSRRSTQPSPNDIPTQLDSTNNNILTKNTASRAGEDISARENANVCFSTDDPISPTSLQSNRNTIDVEDTLAESGACFRSQQLSNVPEQSLMSSGQVYQPNGNLLDPSNGSYYQSGTQLLSPQMNPSQNIAFGSDNVGFSSGFQDPTFFDSNFLEDTLLPEINFGFIPTESLISFMGRNDATPRRVEQPVAIEYHPVTNTGATPRPEDKDSPQWGERLSGSGGFQMTQNEVTIFEENIMAAHGSKMLQDFRMPTRPSIVRFLNAYFTYFDPHTPIVHYASFSISDTHPALILSMLAIGALHVSEFHFATKAYDAAIILLGQRELEDDSFQDENFCLWPIQATLLCAQFGAFSDDQSRSRRAQYQLSFTSTMLRHGLDKLAKLRLSANPGWATWAYLQTYTRLASWNVILSSVILSYDPTTSSLIPPQSFDLPLPEDRDVWYALSSQEWQQRRANSSSHGELGLFGASKMILQGETIPVPLTSFGLLALIGAILSYICSHERMSMGLGNVFKSDFTSRMENSLAIWESLWRKNPRAEQTPSNQGDPLMADCFSLLGSARYHLYVGKEILFLKNMAADSQGFICQPDIQISPDMYKAIRYAASSWLVRAKIGVAHLERTAALSYGGHSLITAYEGALLMSWWFSLEGFRHRSPQQAQNQRHGVLDDIFEEIFQVLSDQGIECNATNKTTVPLDFYRRLMVSGFWTYGNIMSRSLETFSRKIQQAQPGG